MKRFTIKAENGNIRLNGNVVTTDAIKRLAEYEDRQEEFTREHRKHRIIDAVQLVSETGKNEEVGVYLDSNVYDKGDDTPAGRWLEKVIHAIDSAPAIEVYPDANEKAGIKTAIEYLHDQPTHNIAAEITKAVIAISSLLILIEKTRRKRLKMPPMSAKDIEVLLSSEVQPRFKELDATLTDFVEFFLNQPLHTDATYGWVDSFTQKQLGNKWFAFEKSAAKEKKSKC